MENGINDSVEDNCPAPPGYGFEWHRQPTPIAH